MGAEKRINGLPDRRVRSRNGRRESDAPKPWYVRRRWWLAAASMMFVGWKRVRRKV